jgi:hypothetical protein
MAPLLMLPLDMLPLDMEPLDMEPEAFFFLAAILSLSVIEPLVMAPLDIELPVDMEALPEVDMPPPAACARATPEIPIERPIASTAVFPNLFIVFSLNDRTPAAGASLRETLVRTGLGRPSQVSSPRASRRYKPAVKFLHTIHSRGLPSSRRGRRHYGKSGR